MGVTALQHRFKIGNFDNSLASIPRVKYKSPSDRNFSTPGSNMGPNVCVDPIKHAKLLMAYIYIIIITLILSMYIDIINSHNSTGSITSVTSCPGFFSSYANKSLSSCKFLINWAVVILFFSSHLSNERFSCAFFVMRRSKVQRCTVVNVLYQMFLNKATTCLYYLSIMNLLLIVIVTPSIVNPGPETRPLSLFYNNVHGLINPNELKSNTPSLNMVKIHELHGFLYKHKPDIIILNETWLKPSILDSEVLPDIYKLWREDRSERTHPWDPSKPKKFRKGGGGVLIACRRDIDVECTKVGFIKVQAEILSLNIKLASGKRLNVSTFYRVGNLENENFEEFEKFLTALAIKKKLDKHILIGYINFPEISWPDPSTTNKLHKKFINLLVDDLGHSQMINEPTHKGGNILDLLFTNIPDMISDISVL